MASVTVSAASLSVRPRACYRRATPSGRARVVTNAPPSWHRRVEPTTDRPPARARSDPTSSRLPRRRRFARPARRAPRRAQRRRRQVRARDRSRARPRPRRHARNIITPTRVSPPLDDSSPRSSPSPPIPHQNPSRDQTSRRSRHGPCRCAEGGRRGAQENPGFNMAPRLVAGSVFVTDGSPRAEAAAPPPAWAAPPSARAPRRAPCRRRPVPPGASAPGDARRHGLRLCMPMSMPFSPSGSAPSGSSVRRPRLHLQHPPVPVDRQLSSTGVQHDRQQPGARRRRLPAPAY